MMRNWMAGLSPSVTSMIRMDHAQVLATFHQFHAGTSAGKKHALAMNACIALDIHTRLEEEVFYPALREVAPTDEVLARSVPEHAEVRRLIVDLQAMAPQDVTFETTFLELMRQVQHHLADEETTLLPMAERLLAERLGELGARMTSRRVALTASRGGDLLRHTLRSMPQSGLLIASGALAAGAYLLSRASASSRPWWRR